MTYRLEEVQDDVLEFLRDYFEDDFNQAMCCFTTDDVVKLVVEDENMGHYSRDIVKKAVGNIQHNEENNV